MTPSLPLIAVALAVVVGIVGHLAIASADGDVIATLWLGIIAGTATTAGAVTLWRLATGNRTRRIA